MNDDWSKDGDLGLARMPKRNGSGSNATRNRTESCSSCGRFDNNRPTTKKAVIRTLSGSRFYKQGEGNGAFRRRSLGAAPECLIADQRPLTTAWKKCSQSSRRTGSITSCPDVLRKLRHRISVHLAKGQEMGSDHKTQRVRDGETLLREANLTISALQGKLDVYEELLYGKSRASEVLLHKLNETVHEKVTSEQQWRTEVQEQRREASRLQFQLLSFEGTLTDTQRAWLDRINSVVKENAELQSTIHTQGRLIRRLSSEKTQWKKECHELHSLEDARERQAYQRSNSVSEMGSAAEQAIIELAILGSCVCRAKNQEPCECAKSACRRHQEVGKLYKKVSELEAQNSEMHRLMEIYREAFEEQLQRSRDLTKKVVKLDRENEIITRNSTLNALLRLRIHKDSQSSVINSLVDTMCDKTDALLQQQILTKLLSRRLTELESSNLS